MEQTNLTPEQRKQIAKFAGYTIYYDRCGDDDFSELYYAVNENNKIGWPGDYTPDTNDAQAMELLKEMVKRITDHRWLWTTLINITRNGELTNLDICHAVLALLEEEG